MIRIRRGLRQTDVAKPADLSRATIARHENGQIQSVDALERHAAVLDLRVEIRVWGRGGDIARLADEEHAAIVELIAGRFREAGWSVEIEASFNDRGERGRIDLLAFDSSTGTLVTVEVKTELTDLQALFGSMSVKVRHGAALARARSWRVVRVVPLLAVASTYLNRTTVRKHPASFVPYPQQGFATRWLSRLSSSSGILLWIPSSESRKSGWIAGRRRVRPPTGRSRRDTSGPSGPRLR